MNREAELAAIERFLSSREATRCPAAYVAPTVGALPADDGSPPHQPAETEGGAVMGRVDAGPVGEPGAALGLNAASRVGARLINGGDKPERLANGAIEIATQLGSTAWD